MNKQTIRIRMYRVGFGDCFLLSIPSVKNHQNDRQQHILIDCGVHSRGDIGTIEKVVDNISEITDKKLAMIIATHAHQDHISGFSRFEDIFTNFKVREVWLPWTWNEKDKKALEIQKRQNALTKQLFQHFQVQGPNTNQNALYIIENLNLKENIHAIELLKSGFGDYKTKVRYLRAGDILMPNDTHIPELIVNILGPPTSEEFLRQMNPPTSQRYLRMLENKPEIVNTIEPFASKWKIDPELIEPKLDEKEKKELQNLAKISLDDLAFALDQARNNESIVTLFIINNKHHLLFAGDAQYGNWRWWLENERFNDILTKINFFKIGHHGSHNATPKKALEAMSDGGFVAMVSTQSEPWNSIPRNQLITKLSEKTMKHMVRSDWLDVEGAPKPLPDAESSTPSIMPEGFSKGDLWIDYMIQL